MTERTGNVYENKGSALHSLERSGDFAENTGSYEFEAGMSLKRKDVGWGKNRIQDPGVRSQKRR
jgi:hypothetical protein